MWNKPIVFVTANDPQEDFSQIWLQGKYENKFKNIQYSLLPT
jgi:hypothetical protein